MNNPRPYEADSSKMRLPGKPQGVAAVEPEHRSARGDKFNDTLLVAMKGLGGESLEVVGSQLPRYQSISAHHDPRSATSLTIKRANLSGPRSPVKF
jgi:hypothetical protein